MFLGFRNGLIKPSFSYFIKVRVCILSILETEVIEWMGSFPEARAFTLSLIILRKIYILCIIVNTEQHVYMIDQAERSLIWRSRSLYPYLFWLAFAKLGEVTLSGFGSDTKRVSSLACWVGSFSSFTESFPHSSQPILGESTQRTEVSSLFFRCYGGGSLMEGLPTFSISSAEECA